MNKFYFKYEGLTKDINFHEYYDFPYKRHKL